MTLDNLKLALQLNNANTNQEINLLISYVNQFATNQKILHYEINNKFQSLDNDIDQLNSNLTYQVSLLDTKFTNRINSLSDDYGLHKNDTDIHITAAERDKWNSTAKYTDDTVKSHADNLIIHVTQADKDIWNATLGNAKTYAKSLFDQLTSFEIIKCTELPIEDIKTMTIYFLQIDPEQDDLYEEYMYLDGQWEKIGNTRIDLSDYVTKEMLQSEVDTLNNTITTKETAINQAISDLEDKHDQDVQDLQDDIDELTTTVSNLSDSVTQNITDTAQSLQDEIDNLEDKHGQDIESINQNIETIEQSIQGLGDDVDKIHTHANKSVLDNLTQTVIDNSHTHSNKSVLDKLSIDSDNNLLYDGSKVCDVSDLINSLNDYAKKTDLHTHSNKAILDKFSVGNDNTLLFDGNPIINANYVTAQSLATTLGNYVSKVFLTNTLHDYATKTDLNNIPTHNHANKTVLDKLSVDNDGDLNYNGQKVAQQGSSSGTGTDHTHSNKRVLDGFGVDTNNNLTYNNTEVISQFTSVDVTLLMDFLWPDQAEGGFVTKDSQYIITSDEYIFVPHS